MKLSAAVIKCFRREAVYGKLTFLVSTFLVAVSNLSAVTTVLRSTSS